MQGTTGRGMQVRGTSSGSPTLTSHTITTASRTISTSIVASMVLLLLLSFATLFIENQLQPSSQQQQSSSSSLPIPPLAYADKIKLKNKSLINDISDQLVNLGSGKDELQNILQQIQVQIALTAGQDKATNVIKQIKSVIELNPNGPLSESLLFLAKQQAAGNIEDVNKVTTEVSRYAASSTDNIAAVLEQAVASLGLQPQQLPQSTTTDTRTTTDMTTTPSESSSSSVQSPANNAVQQIQEAQPLEQLLQLQQSAQPQSVNSSPPPLFPTSVFNNSNNISRDNNTNSANTNTVRSNSSPHSTIKVTSDSQYIDAISPLLPPSSHSPQQQLQREQQQQVIQHRIEEVINRSSSDNINTSASLPQFINK